jgi:hypothetical protein
MRHKFGVLDYVFLGLAITSVGAYFIGVGFLQIRQANAIPSLYWPLRKYYLKKVSDKAMQPSVTWKYLKFEMCKRFEVAQAKYASPVGAVIGDTMSGMGKALGTGMPLCDPIAACRENLMHRCLQYDLMAYTSLAVMIMNLVGVILWLCGASMLMFSCKPKVRFTCAFTCMFGSLVFFGGLIFYEIYWNKMDKALRGGMVWPSAGLYGPGWWTAALSGLAQVAAIAIMILAAFFAKAAELVDDMMAPSAMGPGTMPDGGMPVAY